MTTKLITLGLSLLPFCVFADEVPGMVITKTDDTSLSLTLSSIRSIKFQEGNMLIQQTDNNTQQISIDQIALISFSDVASAIQSIAGDEGYKSVIVTDLTGKVLYKGEAGSQLPSDIHGTVIVSIDGQSHKIHIR